MDGETIKWMKRVAAEKKLFSLGSVIIKENENYFNRLDMDVTQWSSGYL